MARERRPPSVRSSTASNKKQAKDATETQYHHEKPATEKDDNSHTTAPLAGDESLKHDNQQQGPSSETEDNRTLQQLVHDYGDDMLSLNELFHARPFISNVGAQTETDEGK